MGKHSLVQVLSRVERGLVAPNLQPETTYLAAHSGRLVVMDVETLAVNKISGLIAMCPYLLPVIATNDKTLFTDGHIDIFSGVTRSKEEWVGRVTVQVKGRAIRPGRKPPRSYQISRTDLQAFQSDSGVLYFVVHVDPETGESHPLYALLSPFNIERILNRSAPTSKRLSVPFKTLPASPGEIDSIMRVAHKTRAQPPTAIDVSSLLPRMKSISVYVAQTLNFDAPVSLIPGVVDFALELHTMEGLSLPLGGELQIFPQSFSPRVVDVRVECAGVAFDQVTMRRTGDETAEMRICEGLVLRFKRSGGALSMNVAFALADFLPERLNALSFFIGLHDRNPLLINGSAMPTENIKGDDDPELRRHLHYLRQLADLFELLGADTRLVNLTEIDKEQHRQLQFAHLSLVELKELMNDTGEESIMLLSVGRWELMLLVMKGSQAGRWRYVNPFDPKSRYEFRAGQTRTADDAHVPATIYEMLDEEQLQSVLNLRLDRITEAYDVIADLPDTAAMVNRRVLALITAADASKERREEFLDAAHALNEWLATDGEDQPEYLVNMWQILWRRGQLTSTHRSEIRSLKRLMTSSTLDLAALIEVACAFLLGDREEANDCMERLTPKELASLQSWPLWALREPPVANPVASTAG